ncbi:glycosyltransferase family 4 protein [Pseudarthrobacter sp. IC2-21]|uniref:glycosyltransferase family 4 protein n=1 Tax=Pseudarthrobacter sp. IC2-21 TaxID=3092262 RepID=UPI002A6AE457|nr:glycosyltransferase family 4 protein [Pseudarthrobacter sp. IC2-21]
MTEALKVSPSNIQVIRNWTHLKPTPPFDRAAMRQRLGWHDSEIIVLHAGNIGKKQGLENVLEAARLADERTSPVRFVLMGDGNQRKRLEALATDLGSISFLDPVSSTDFPYALGAADVLLVNELPSVRDMSVPSKLTSYFNAGVAVVAATDAGSVTADELLASGGGLRIDPADPNALLNAVEGLANDPELSASLGARGLEFRNDTLSEATAIRHYDELITSLASSRGL